MEIRINIDDELARDIAEFAHGLSIEEMVVKAVYQAYAPKYLSDDREGIPTPEFIKQGRS